MILFLTKALRYNYLIVILAIMTIMSCGKDYNLTEEQEQVVEYFKDVAVGFEFCNGQVKVTRKWASNMRLFIDGNYSLELKEKIEKTVDEINALCTDGFEISFVEELSRANCHLYCGSSEEFVEIYPQDKVQAEKNIGLFSVWWNNGNRLIGARIFVNTSRASSMQQQSLVLEELTQSLGLGKDSNLYSKSIFYETQTNGGFATEYAPIDRELIRLLYHPDMEFGLNEEEVDLLLRQILANE